MFWEKYEKYQRFFFVFFFLSENFQFSEEKFSIYFNRRVFVMAFRIFRVCTIFLHWNSAGSKASSCAKQRRWSDCADMQADMCCWHNPEGTSSQVAALTTYTWQISRHGGTQIPSERVSTLKGNNLLPLGGSKFFPFRVDPFSKGRQNTFKRITSWKCIQSSSTNCSFITLQENQVCTQIPTRCRWVRDIFSLNLAVTKHTWVINKMLFSTK